MHDLVETDLGGSLSVPSLHLRSVKIGSDIVIMDLYRGHYHALIGSDDDADSGTKRSPDFERIIVVADGCLKKGPAPGDMAVSLAAAPQYRDLPPSVDLPRLTFADWAGIGVAVLGSWRLRMMRPHRWLVWHASIFPERVVDEADIVQLVLKFRQATLFLPGISLCLSNSMALSRFLRRRGIRTRWVFAARTYPFEAHCWLEWGDLILNDQADHIRWFTPIVTA